MADKIKRLAQLLLCSILWVVFRPFIAAARRIPVPGDGVDRVIILAWGGIGNMVLMTPLLLNLRRIFPRAEIAVVANPNGSGDVVEGSGYVDTVIIEQDTGFKDLYRKARGLRAREKRTLFICGTGIDPIVGTLYSYISGSKYRAGEAGRMEGFLYTHTIKVEPKKHELLRDLDLLRAIGYQPQTLDPVFYIPDITMVEMNAELSGLLGSASRFAVLAPGSGVSGAFKRWPKEYFAEIGKYFVSMGVPVVIVGEKSEALLCENIRALIGDGAYSCAGRWTLKKSAACVAMARIVIANDSGIMHIASALKVPVVGIFGPTLHWKSSPRGRLSKVVRLGLDCSPCYKFCRPVCPYGIKCLTELHPDAVKGAILELDKEAGCLR